MFYAQFVLSKKGPLAKIWLAAHWEKKLTKTHVFETSIEKSVEGILQPKVKLALRTTGHLLLGVVRIYSRKAKYLLADCNEAFVKIKMAFRPGIIDLPEDCRDTALTTITLPQVFHDFDTSLADLNNLDLTSHLALNQAREDEITLKEDFSFSNFNGSGFGMEMGDMMSGGGMGGFGEEMMLQPGAGLLVGGDDYLTQDGSSLMTIDDIMRREKEGSFAGSFINAGNNEKLLLQDHIDKNMETSEHDLYNKNMHDDGFGAGIGDGGLLSEGFIGESGLFDEPPMSVATLGDDNVGGLDDDLDDDPIGGILSHPPQTPASVGAPHSAGAPSSSSILPGSPSSTSLHLFRSVALSPKSSGTAPLLPGSSDLSNAQLNATLGSSRTHQLTLGQHTFDEREVFTLEPLDATAYTGTGEKQVRSKRRRKLVVDQSKGIDGDEMRAQLADSSDLVTDLDLAPPSKKLMQWKETGGVGKLLHLPGYPQKCKNMLKLMTQQINVSSKYSQDTSDGPCVVGTMDDDDVDSGATNLSAGKRGGAGSHRASNEESGNQAKRSRTDDTSPEKRLDASHRSADYDYDEESHASPGGYVDEDDDYFNRDTPSAPNLPPHVRSEAGNSHTLTPDAMPHPMDDFQLEPLQLEAALPEQDIQDSVLNSGPVEPEELQEEGESFETFQERVWGKRALAFFTNIKQAFDTPPSEEHQSRVLTFSTFTHHHPSGRRMDRKTVAAKFYSLLVLKKDQVIDIAQDEAYGPIYISKGLKYVA